MEVKKQCYQLQNIKKLGFVAVLAVGGLAAFAQQSPVDVTWIMGQNEAEPNMYSSTFIIKNISPDSLKNDWKFYYNNFARQTKVIGENAELAIDQFIPSYYRLVPTENYKTLAPGDSIKLNFLTKHSLRNISFKPDGGHFVYEDGQNKPLAVNINVPIFTDSVQWTIPGKKLATYPDGHK